MDGISLDEYLSCEGHSVSSDSEPPQLISFLHGQTKRNEGICTAIQEGKRWQEGGAVGGRNEDEQWTLEFEIRVIDSSFRTLSR